MSNQSMPGIFKIGCTSRKPEERALDLYTTGVPTPFIVEYSIYIYNYRNIERLTHESLYQYKHNKEFFKLDLKECILELKRIAISKSSYKEKYRTTRLKSIVEGWEKEYLEKKRKVELEKKLQKERERADLERKKIEEYERKLKRKKIENEGCLIIAISFAVALWIQADTGESWGFIIATGIWIYTVFFREKNL